MEHFNAWSPYRNGFVQNDADQCFYSKESKNEKVILLMWVGDLIIFASISTLLNDVKEMLKRQFKMKDMGPLKHFLVIDFRQSEREVRMTQKRHRRKTLAKFGMSECKPRTPLVNRSYILVMLLIQQAIES